jgi:CDP-paratose 2-epimerase
MTQSSDHRIIVTGGAGFIGSNTVARLLAEGRRVTVIDNLSRPGSEINLQWLQSLGDIDFRRVDLRDADATAQAVGDGADLEAVIHLAGQVAVTTSLVDPRADFETNALGTLNVLEAVRATGCRPVMLFASTNKVYGGLEWVDLAERETRWECTSHPRGLDESAPLDFHSPYGCSKGAADQYIHDYGRCYGLPTVVLRQSCIMGPRQFGVEDQGWVAWFLIAAMQGRRVTVFGDGKQVRDLLWVEDLVDLYLRLIARGDEVAGEIFNVGGGAERTLSLLELLSKIETLRGQPLDHGFSEPRTGDQRWFVADSTRLAERMGWHPSKTVDDAIGTLWSWLQDHRKTIESAIDGLPSRSRVR